MIYTIKNENLTVKICSLGAEMKSMVCNGLEYVWQGNPKYWAGSAPIMFPICGRLPDGEYTYNGKTYSMPLHGFARKTEFELLEIEDSKVSFILKSTPATKEMYPFDFEFTVTYRLNGKSVVTEMKVQNLGENKMYFTLGGHPAFNVPVTKDEKFTDYSVVFPTECPAKVLEFSYRYLKTGNYPLFMGENFKELPLTHDLFDNDAKFLKDTPKSAKLISKKGVGVQMDFEDMKYLGIWHTTKTDAPFVCLEPWCGSPALEGEIAVLENRDDTFTLEKGEFSTKSFTVTVI